MNLHLGFNKGHRVKCYDNNIQALNSVYVRYQSDKAQLYTDQVIESPNFTGNYLLNDKKITRICKDVLRFV